MAIPTPIAYWKLDETSGNRADSLGSYLMTDNNGVGFTALGKIGNGSTHVRASNQFLSNASIGTAIGNAYTFAGWFNLPDIGLADQTIVSFRPAAGSANIIQIEMGNYSGGNLRAIAFSSAGVAAKDFRKSQASVPINTWHHVAITWDGTNFLMYHNGSTSGVTATSNSAMTQTATTRTLRLGAELSASNVANGSLDEMGVWNTALTSAQILELYNSGAGLTYPFPSDPFVKSQALTLLNVG